MGTRHLICIVKNNEYKLAQYGQWDGYPDGQGAKILDFLTNEFDRPLFENNLSYIFKPTEEQTKQWWREVGFDLSEQSPLYEVAVAYYKLHPSLSRDTGADILQLIQLASGPLPHWNDIEFAADSLMCEWAYVIDLDKNTFEVFKGFNKSPLPDNERFVSLPLKEDRMSFKYSSNGGTYQYYQVKLQHSFKLNDLPSADEFISLLSNLDEDE